MSVEERVEKYTEAHIILLILSSQAPQEPPADTFVLCVGSAGCSWASRGTGTARSGKEQRQEWAGSVEGRGENERRGSSDKLRWEVTDTFVRMLAGGTDRTDGGLWAENQQDLCSEELTRGAKTRNGEIKKSPLQSSLHCLIPPCDGCATILALTVGD